MKHQYTFHTRCVETTADKLEAMYATQREIGYRTALKHIGRAQLNDIFPLYADPNSPLKSLGRDYAVSFYRGRFDGLPCINIEHSRIDHIFILPILNPPLSGRKQAP